jgi:sialic acid synthase SpsE
LIEGLIAEISNHHFGDFEEALELIRIAKESGADYVKMQAFKAEDVTTGSMPVEFYERCSMPMEDYIACIDYGEFIGIPVFFSTFSYKYEELFLRRPRMIRKIASGQVGESMYGKLLANHNNDNTIISIKNIDLLKTYQQYIDKMNLMYVTPYNYPISHLWEIEQFKEFTKSPVGFSDHSITIDNCKTAITKYGCRLIEKHFYLGKDIRWDGKLFRDCVHSATPNEFEKLAKYYREQCK